MAIEIDKDRITYLINNDKRQLTNHVVIKNLSKKIYIVKIKG